MKKYASIAALAAMTSVTAAPLWAGTVEPVEEEEDPFVVAEPVGSSASLGAAGTAAAVAGGVIAVGAIAAASDSDSAGASTTTTNVGN
ncbi:hypothetical protein [Roseovarius sp. SYSU LYC5161]|uniref:hypothetical protein n=1 Tax=Roseovarius halophilus (ex Wu et al. 2025) TaxID=3376060 RepID=UPI002872239C|nr:hypothetical protein [Roseovarius sp.]